VTLALRPAAELLDRLAAAPAVRLFLDYDGTLAEFAPTPDHILPDEELIGLLERLGRHPRVDLAVISGRRLGHIQELLPVPGVLLAGTYGVEMLLPEGGLSHQADYETIRPVLDALEPRWQALIAGREGFYLEDKGWALGIHARRAGDREAGEVLDAAARLLDEILPHEAFRVLGGYKFIEIGPALAHKGETLRYLLERYPTPQAALVYLGDDDKDEEAFEEINRQGGSAVLVAREPRPTLAEYRLESPRQARRWLADLLTRLSSG
jgi:trehalose 6-phosphate phosphatase